MSVNPFADNPGSPVITARRVPGAARLRFWPQHFDRIPQWLLLEAYVFSMMKRLCRTYSGGSWDFYTLSNGGAYIAPASDERWCLDNSLNGHCEHLTADAAGIAVCLLAYSHHACRTECDAMTAHYYHLRDFALDHPECRAILRITD